MQSFPTPQYDGEAKRPDETANYLAYLLDLADRLFNGNKPDDEEAAA